MSNDYYYPHFTDAATKKDKLLIQGRSASKWQGPNLMAESMESAPVSVWKSVLIYVVSYVFFNVISNSKYKLAQKMTNLYGWVN